MKRLVISAPRTAEYEEVRMPTCPAGGVLVRAVLTAISTGTELRVYRGLAVDEEGKFLHEWVPFELPTENGYSMVGEIVECGAELSDALGVPLALGDRVFLAAPHRQYASAEARDVFKLPSSIPDEEAVFLNIVEVAHAALRRGNPAPGGNVAIVGQGIIGLSAVAYCRAFGLRSIAVDISSERLQRSREMGADLVVQTSGEPVDETTVAEVAAFCADEGPDLVLEAASSWNAIRTAMDLVRSHGTVVVVARHIHTPEFNPAGRPYFGKSIILTTSYGYPPAGDRWDRQRSFALTLDLLQRRRLEIKPCITDRVDWTELPATYDRLDRGDPAATGIVVRW